MSLSVGDKNTVKTLPKTEVKPAKQNEEPQKKAETNQYKGVPDTELFIMGELVDQKFEETKARLDSLQNIKADSAEIKKYNNTLKQLQRERNLILQEFKTREGGSKPKLNTKG